MSEIEILKKLGLTEYESNIVLVLLHLGASKVGEIIKRCSVPRNKAYECLEKLSKRGIVEVIPSNPKKYFIKNTDSLKILIKDKEDELELLKNDFEKIEKIKIDRLPQSVNESVGIIYGHGAFVSKLKESMESVCVENLVVARKVRVDPIMLRLTENAIKRGAKIKMLMPKIQEDNVKEWMKIGVKIRFLDKLPEITFSTFDDKICRLNLMISTNIADPDPTLWIENRAFISILREKFNNLWKNCKSVD